MTGDVPGRPLSPTLPWAARLGLRAPRHTLLACRVPPFEPRTSIGPAGYHRHAPIGPARPGDGPVAAANSLLA